MMTIQTQGVKKRILTNTDSKTRVAFSREILSFIVNTEYFPQYPVDVAFARVMLFFAQATSVRIEYGDGNSFESASALAWGIGNQGPDNSDTFPAYMMAPHRYLDFATKPTHTVTIYYTASVLQELHIISNQLPVQDFGFAFYEHKALQVFELTTDLMQAGPIATTDACFVALDLDNVQFCKSFTDLYLSRCFNSTSPYSGAIPLLLLDLPLRLLSIGDIAWEGTGFSANNLDQLPLIKNSLQELFINYKIGDTNGGDGPLPGNFWQLHRLINFTANDATWSAIPAMLNDIRLSTITSLSFLGTDLVNWGNLSNLTNLTRLNMTRTKQLATAVPGWFKFTPVTSLIMQQCFEDTGPSPRPGAIDDFITSLHNFVTTTAVPGTWEDVSFLVGPVSGAASYANCATPNSTSIGLLNNLVTNYGWTVDYKH